MIVDVSGMYAVSHTSSSSIVLFVGILSIFSQKKNVANVFQVFYVLHIDGI